MKTMHQIPKTDTTPIDREMRAIVTKWAIDTVEGFEDEKSEVVLAAAYCLQYESALSETEKRLGRIRSQMCDKKKSFPTKSAATKVSRKFDQRAYECPICYCWHLTSQTNNQQGSK